MEKHLGIINELLDRTSFLEEEYVFNNNDAYPPFIEGTARKSYYYLYTLQQLATDEKNGDAVIDLSRSLLESMIVVMWVQEFGKEQKAKKMLMYAPVEAWSDGEYAIEAGIELPPDAIEARRKDFEAVKGDYLRPTKKELALKDSKRALRTLEKLGINLTDVQKQEFTDAMTEGKSDEEVINKSWAGVDLETMMLQLGEKGKFPGNLKSSFEKIYTFGNRKNHLSPNDIDLLLAGNDRKKRNQSYNMNIGVYVSLLSYIKIMIELAELRKDEELKKKLEALEDKLLSR